MFCLLIDNAMRYCAAKIQQTFVKNKSPSKKIFSLGDLFSIRSGDGIRTRKTFMIGWA